jgi:tRNA-binding protein
MADQINFEDFEKVDIRIGTVVDAVVPEWSHWVMKLTVNLGEEIGERIIFAGVMKHYKPKELIGKQFPFVVNIKPKKMGPEDDYSNGMLLAAGDDRPYLFSLQEKVANGTKVR